MTIARCLRAVGVLVVLGSCSGDGDPEAATTTTTTTSTSTAPNATTAISEFTGDPDSPFCRLVDEAGDRPVLDPFEADLGPREVELRFRALRNRFVEFAEVAPAELAEVLDTLVGALAGLETVLEENDYDFAQVGESGVDTDVFDDPAFLDAASRIAAYNNEVCVSAPRR